MRLLAGESAISIHLAEHPVVIKLEFSYPYYQMAKGASVYNKRNEIIKSVVVIVLIRFNLKNYIPYYAQMLNYRNLRPNETSRKKKTKHTVKKVRV
jgi:hypothetical protein